MKIITNHCEIAPLVPDDIPRLSQLNTDPKVLAFLGGPVSKETASKRLADSLTSHKTVHYVPRLNTDQNLVGLIMLSCCQGTSDMELAYLFFPQYWGKGYAHETIAAVITHAFNAQNIANIFAETQSANIKSTKLLQRLGLKHTKTIIRFEAEQSVFEIGNPNYKPLSCR